MATERFGTKEEELLYGQLFQEIGSNNLEGVQRLLKKDTIDVNRPFPMSDMFPIHLAAARINGIEIVDALSGEGADPRVKTRRHCWMTPIAIAIENNRLEHVEFFISKGVGINEEAQAGGNRPLHVAVQMANDARGLGMIRALLRLGACPNQANDIGNTPLHNLAFCHSNCDTSEVWSLMLANGANAKRLTSNEEGVTALHLAAGLGNVKVVELLLARKVDTRLMSTAGQTALGVALSSYLACLSYREQHSTLKPRREAIRLLCQAGFKTEEKRKEQGAISYLEQVVSSYLQHKDLVLVCTLLKFRAVPDEGALEESLNRALNLYRQFVRDQERRPIMELIRVLEQAGADVCAYVPTETEGTEVPILCHVLQFGLLEPLKLFVEKGRLDPNMRVITKDGGKEMGHSRPLHVVINFNHFDLAEYLASHPKIDISAMDYKGCTPLDIARERKNAKIEALLKKSLNK